MRRRIAWVSAAALVGLLLMTVLPATTFLPSATIGATGGQHGPPSSKVQALPTYTTTQVVTISYTSYKHGHGPSGGDDHDDDDDNDDDDGVSALDVGSTGGNTLSAAGSDGRKAKFWTELFYKSPDASSWTLYTPPWNTDGRWFGVRGPEHHDVFTGIIPFDTYYTGGEALYNFTTVAVSKKDGREAIDAA